MGTRIGARCLDCDEDYSISEGGGFFFHLLRCDTCGQGRSVGFDELGETHLRYLKGLNGPYAMVSAEHDRRVQEDYDGEPLAEEDYHREVERLAGACECGGSFRFDAPPRCPACRSTRYEPAGGMILYD